MAAAARRVLDASRLSRARLTPIAVVVGAAVALALTHPLLLHPSSWVLDDGTWDAYQSLWNVWWVRESLTRLATNPFFTRYLFYPARVSLVFHTFSFTLGLASVPLQVCFGLVPAYNVLVAAAPALSVVVVTLLAREVVGDPSSALAAGLVATLNPMMLWFLPGLYLTCGYLVAGLLLLWWRMHRRRRIADVATTVALLLALILASPEYALVALALLALDSACRLLAPRLFDLPRWVGGTVAFWCAAAAVLGALAAVAFADPATPPPPQQVLLGSGYALGLVTPPWVTPPPSRFWRLFYLGTVPLVLLPVALVRGGRRARYWVLALLVAAFMALGPRLHLRNPLPDMAAGRAVSPGLPGPYSLVAKLVPPLRFLRAPYRWMAGAQIALPIVTAFAIAGVRASVRRPGLRTAATGALLVLIVAFGLLDGHGLRAPLVSTAVPAAYGVLGADSEPAAVVELPAGLVAERWALFASRYMYYQTAHRKFLLEGTLARLPRGAEPLLERSITDFAALPWVKYVVVHRDLLESALPAARRQAKHIAALARVQGRLVAYDGATAVYRLRTYRRAAVQ